MQLSKHFSINEFLKSDHADTNGIDNVPDYDDIQNMKELCRWVMEPIRERWGPTAVSSGYRIWTPDSQHGKGEAADFECRDGTNIEVAQWIVDNLDFDQLILEYVDDDVKYSGWIHCSFKGGRAGDNRNEVLSAKRNSSGKTYYVTGLDWD
jgi:zinc D-Ala-D-Ala carboxypeptidase